MHYQSDICFVQTRYQYDSYTDFRRLVEVSGFSSCFVDEVRLDESKTYIVTPSNGEWRPHIQNEQNRVPLGSRRACLVWWNLERGWNPGEVGPSADGLGDMLLWCDKVWISDRSWATALANIHGLDRIRNVPLGSNTLLGSPGRTKKYDLIHLSYVTHRRSLVYNQMLVRRTIAENCWGDLRHERLQQSRALFGIHQDEKPIIEPLRFALAASYGLPILTESVSDTWPYQDGVSIIVFNYNEAAQAIEDIFSRGEPYLMSIGEAGRKLMTEDNTFRSFIEHEVSNA